MKECYPIILERCEDGSGYLVKVPDFGSSTFGTTIPEAVEMARDAISAIGLSKQDHNEAVPVPSDINAVECKSDEIKTLVDVDFTAYRRMLDNRSVKKNCTIPSWLNDKAEKAGINFSAVLQEALKQKLAIVE
ncbi:MAG: type II toxin-antitoxin system HicB family antitoxin [Ruminococcus sp.]|nr:type II toxin-antitoxin system HicB family antitoxin [Ruminococcus sp.]